MNKQKQFDNKYKSTQQQQQNDDDEQIEKTLNFFDAILDPYLNDEDIIDEKSDHQVKSTSDIIIQEKKHDFNVSFNVILPIQSFRIALFSVLHTFML